MTKVKCNNSTQVILVFSSQLICALLIISTLIFVPSLSAGDTPIYSEETVFSVFGVENGLGYELREQVRTATDQVKAGYHKEALALLNQIETDFRDLMNDSNITYVSVATQEEFDLFRQNTGGSNQVAWIDWGFREILHLKAFIKVSSGRFDQAVQLLIAEANVAPFSAAPYTELGYLMNKEAKRPADALKAYTKALELSQQFSSSSSLQAAALRGIGFSLIELGDLDRARAALIASLSIDPNNEIAKNELAYIAALRKKRIR